MHIKYSIYVKVNVLYNNHVKNGEDTLKRSTCLTTLVKPYDLTLLVWEGNRGLNARMNRNRLV